MGIYYIVHSLTIYDTLVGSIKCYWKYIHYIALYFRNTCNHIILKQCNYYVQLLDYRHCLSKSYEFNRHMNKHMFWVFLSIFKTWWFSWWIHHENIFCRYQWSDTNALNLLNLGWIKCLEILVYVFKILYIWPLDD